MQQQPRIAEYGAVAKGLHWLTFLLLAAQYVVGELMPHISGKTPNEGLVAWHILIGAVILLVIAVQLIWRLAHPVRLLTAMPPWQQYLALATHWTLYALIVVITVLGWGAASFRGWEVKIFGVLPLPALAAKGTPWVHEAGDVHVVLVYVLLGVIALHVGGALYHQFITRDRVLARMLPGLPAQPRRE
jgi:cytochrome b561